MEPFVLLYKPHARIEDLGPGECTVHRAGDGSGKRWWNLWFRVPRETDGQLEDFVVPITLSAPDPNGPGGRSWGVTYAGSSAWQVSPSINVLEQDAKRAPNGEVTQLGGRRIVAGTHPVGRSLWHQTPRIVSVPDGEPWTKGGPS